LPTSSATRAFATDPPAYLPVGDATVVDEPRFFLKVSPDGSRAAACRLAADPREIWDAVTELAPRARVTWMTDRTRERDLRALGCRDQDAPLTSYVTALAIEEPPPVVDGIEVRQVVTAEDDELAHEVFERGWGVPRPPVGPAPQWLAFVDGAAVAFGGSLPGPAGVFLTGGVTVPSARGRGAYRALVRARWDDAVERGTPALVVHAEEASRRVLARIGFEHVADVVELVSGPQC
jgi:GNAT superfamily N-acetyltransferase